MLGRTASCAVAVGVRSMVWPPKRVPRNGVIREKWPSTVTWMTLPSVSAHGSGSHARLTSDGVIVIASRSIRSRPRT